MSDSDTPDTSEPIFDVDYAYDDDDNPTGDFRINVEFAHMAPAIRREQGVNNDDALDMARSYAENMAKQVADILKYKYHNFREREASDEDELLQELLFDITPRAADTDVEELRNDIEKVLAAVMYPQAAQEDDPYYRKYEFLTAETRLDENGELRYEMAIDVGGMVSFLMKEQQQTYEDALQTARKDIMEKMKLAVPFVNRKYHDFMEYAEVAENGEIDPELILYTAAPNKITTSANDFHEDMRGIYRAVTSPNRDPITQHRPHNQRSMRRHCTPRDPHSNSGPDL